MDDPLKTLLPPVCILGSVHKLRKAVRGRGLDEGLTAEALRALQGKES